MNRPPNMKIPPDARRTALGLAGALLLAGGGLWLGAGLHRAHRHAGPPPVYTASGYGGFVTPAPPKAAVTRSAAQGKAKQARPAPDADPVGPARAAYSAGRYGEAEAMAQAVIVSAERTGEHRRAAFARQILAYSAARRKDLPLARARFAALETEASRLPDRGKVPAPLGEDPPTLTEEAAFQHAVCTGALGDGKAAEAEYVAFMKAYPDSPLVGAAVKRIARLHGGDVPKEDEAVWRRAQEIAQKRQSARMREASLCGPECLAELLRRRGEAADVHALATEMGTGERGTSLAALAETARKHGFHAQGLALTQKGLGGQRLPLVALIAPGHYVVVEAVTPSQVTVWDPDARGLGKGGRRACALAPWSRAWRGTALALEAGGASSPQGIKPAGGPVRTARR